MFILAVLAVVALCNIRLATDMLPVGVVGDGKSYLTVRSNSETEPHLGVLLRRPKLVEISWPK